MDFQLTMILLIGGSILVGTTWWWCRELKYWRDTNLAHNNSMAEFEKNAKIFIVEIRDDASPQEIFEISQIMIGNHSTNQDNTLVKNYREEDGRWGIKASEEGFIEAVPDYLHRHFKRPGK